MRAISACSVTGSGVVWSVGSVFEDADDDFGQGQLSDLVAQGFNQTDEGGDFGGFCAGVAGCLPEGDALFV